MRKRMIISLLAGIALFPGITMAVDSQPIVIDLKSATRLALETSPYIGSAGASAEMAKAQVNKAKSALQPSVGLESGYSYLSKETIFGTTPVWERNTVINRVGVQQTIYSGGQIQANVNRAQQGYLAAGYGTMATQADVVTNVGVSYFRARQAREAIDLAEASTKSLAASYDVAKKLHESGVVTNSDVLRAQVALTSAQESVITAKNNYNVAIAALRTAIGLPQTACIELATDACDTAPDTAVKSISAERPEIAAGSAFVQAS